MNLHLCILPTSGHPPGVLKSIVYGNLQCYFNQNTNVCDYIGIAEQFAKRLIARGHSLESVQELFLAAATAIDRNSKRKRREPSSQESNEVTNSNTVFFHWEYHPRGIPRQAIRDAYNETVSEFFGDLRLIVAFHRGPNLRDTLTRTQLLEEEGSRASDIFKTLPEHT